MKFKVSKMSLMSRASRKLMQKANKKKIKPINPIPKTIGAGKRKEWLLKQRLKEKSSFP
jgi:hypothetical protein